MQLEVHSRDTSQLAPQFTPYLHTGQRLEVDDHGQIRRGTVGITTGWRPVYLLMHSTRSRGSSVLLMHDTRIIRVKRGNRW